MELSDRIREVAEELRSIQQELNRLLIAGINEGADSPAMCQAVAIPGVSELKLTIDQVRQFLWFYMQVMSGTEAGEETAKLLQRIASDPRVSTHTGAIGFLRQINGAGEYALVHLGSSGRRKPN